MGYEETKRALELAEDEAKSTGFQLPDKKTIEAYAKTYNMSYEQATEYIEKSYAGFSESDSAEGIDWYKESMAAGAAPESYGDVGSDTATKSVPTTSAAPDALDSPRVEDPFDTEVMENLSPSDYASGKITPFNGAAPGITDPIKWAQHIESGKKNGLLREAVPKYNNEISEGVPTCEEILNSSEGSKTRNNAWIIVGRDRNAGVESGYGGKGHTRSAAIDLVVGLQGHSPQDDMIVDKNFGCMNTGMPGDAARIYISQRADIDNYFGICDGYVGNSKLDSAIGIKADSVRIMANKGIKIVTGGGPQQKTSLYGDIPTTYGIDLIAGNRDNVNAKKLDDAADQSTQNYLQPIPKGLNLEDLLGEVVDALLTLNALVSEFANRQINVNSTLMNATVIGGGILGPGTINPLNIAFAQKDTILINSGVCSQLTLQRKELNALAADFLLAGGPYYINSRYNRTN